MEERFTFEKYLDKEEITRLLKQIQFRGLYDKDGNALHPYKDAKFSLVTIHPPKHPTSYPQLIHQFQSHSLFTPQPTIYKTQTDMLGKVDTFLETLGKRIHNLRFEGIQYTWEGKG